MQQACSDAKARLLAALVVSDPDDIPHNAASMKGCDQSNQIRCITYLVTLWVLACLNSVVIAACMDAAG